MDTFKETQALSIYFEKTNLERIIKFGEIIFLYICIKTAKKIYMCVVPSQQNHIL